MKKAILGFALISLCGFAAAGESKARGGYVGAAFGMSVFDDGGAFAGLVVDDQDTSMQIHGGYKIMKHFAVEARYVDLGTFAVDFLDLKGKSDHQKVFSL